MNDNYKLQPLRIPSSWLVNSNNLREIDPSEETIEYFGMYLLEIICSYCHQCIDIAWKPEYDLDGCYSVLVMNTYETFNENTMEFSCYSEDIKELSFETKNRFELVQKIEELLGTHKHHKDPRILKSRGVTDEPSESFRIMLEKDGFSEELGKLIIKDGNKIIQMLLIDHPNVTRSIIAELAKKGKHKKVMNKAKHKLNSPKLWKKI